MFNACPHENGEQIKQIYNLAIMRYINMISLSFERLPELEYPRKRGLPSNLCTNKGKFENHLSAVSGTGR
jgi:hypothetical protein